jgi:hypothetical protein
MDILTWPSVLAAVSARLAFENTRLLSLRFSCVLTWATLSMKVRKEVEDAVHFSGPGGEIY